MQEMEENKAVMLKLREHRAQEGWGRFVQSLLRFYKKCFNCIWLWGWVNQTDVHSPASHCCAFLSFCEHCVTKLSRIFLFIEKKKSFYFCPNRTKWSLKKQQEVWEVIGIPYVKYTAFLSKKDDSQESSHEYEYYEDNWIPVGFHIHVCTVSAIICWVRGVSWQDCTILFLSRVMCVVFCQGGIEWGWAVTSIFSSSTFRNFSEDYQRSELKGKSEHKWHHPMCITSHFRHIFFPSIVCESTAKSASIETNLPLLSLKSTFSQPWRMYKWGSENW